MSSSRLTPPKKARVWEILFGELEIEHKEWGIEVDVERELKRSRVKVGI